MTLPIPLGSQVPPSTPLVGGETALQMRRAGLEDARLLAAMNEQLIVDQRHDNPLRGQQLVDRMSGWLTSGYSAALGTVDGDPALYALWRASQRGGVYLRQFFVLREFRRLGIGSTAIHMLRTDFLPPGAPVTLDVLSHNQTGIDFWHAAGFRDYSISMTDRPTYD